MLRNIMTPSRQVHTGVISQHLLILAFQWIRWLENSHKQEVHLGELLPDDAPDVGKLIHTLFRNDSPDKSDDRCAVRNAVPASYFTPHIFPIRIRIEFPSGIDSAYTSMSKYDNLSGVT